MNDDFIVDDESEQASRAGFRFWVSGFELRQQLHAERERNRRDREERERERYRGELEKERQRREQERELKRSRREAFVMGVSLMVLVVAGVHWQTCHFEHNHSASDFVPTSGFPSSDSPSMEPRVPSEFLPKPETCLNNDDCERHYGSELLFLIRAKKPIGEIKRILYWFPDLKDFKDIDEYVPLTESFFGSLIHSFAGEHRTIWLFATAMLKRQLFSKTSTQTSMWWTTLETHQRMILKKTTARKAEKR